MRTPPTRPGRGRPFGMEDPLLSSGISELGEIRLSVHGHDGRAAETEVVLEGDLGIVDLASLGLTPELPIEFGALREARGAKGVSL